jgi:hypothetical protein
MRPLLPGIRHGFNSLFFFESIGYTGIDPNQDGADRPHGSES